MTRTLLPFAILLFFLSFCHALDMGEVGLDLETVVLDANSGTETQFQHTYNIVLKENVDGFAVAFVKSEKGNDCNLMFSLSVSNKEHGKVGSLHANNDGSLIVNRIVLQKEDWGSEYMVQIGAFTGSSQKECGYTIELTGLEQDTIDSAAGYSLIKGNQALKEENADLQKRLAQQEGRSENLSRTVNESMETLNELNLAVLSLREQLLAAKQQLTLTETERSLGQTQARSMMNYLLAVAGILVIIFFVLSMILKGQGGSIRHLKRTLRKARELYPDIEPPV